MCTDVCAHTCGVAGRQSYTDGGEDSGQLRGLTGHREAPRSNLLSGIQASQQHTGKELEVEGRAHPRPREDDKEVALITIPVLQMRKLRLREAG